MSSENLIVSEVLKELAKIGWKAKIKGKALVRSSLMMPLNKIFDKLRRQQQIPDLETLRAATITEIFTYLERTANPNFRPPGREKREQVELFVDLFFNKILYKIYQGKLTRLMIDEKDIKAAYLFYIRNEITPKEEKEESE
ncbi:hypothetical protein [Anabaena sp. UHCC 0451]|uniref:hypothetical protein n=1 Tax=Anabaena sp. UHCC 0451 TaxID=2055235 RepID=UPI002B220A59|nr:hypothetical protein [Anabaena sp. UHCC 0451]MEA5574894.1 hypothetical protein [Anabaena sp. UHCC 0451]